jgi:TonB-dependent starch-binding outer membrane protein SusC
MTKLYLFSRLLTVLLFFAATSAWSQGRTVTGKVTAADDGSGVPGVNVLEKGTTNGTVTDVDGGFSINVNENATLVFSFVGYTTQEVAVGTQNVIDVALASDVTSLSEVVVIGYGEVRKMDATGAIEVVSKDKFNKGFQTSPEQLIQGRVAGIQITPSSGAPGAATNIRIRGASSIRGGNAPLIVLDGVPLDGRDISAGSDVGIGRMAAKSPLAFLNPNDIESVNVLKDASATAIYGSRGANGVLIISTKKGAQGRPLLQYSGSIGVARMPEGRKYDLLNAEEFKNEVTNTNVHFGANVNAFDEILQDALVQDHNITYGGATESGSYRISLGLQDQEGVIKETGMTKYTGSVRLNQDVFNGRVQLQTSLITSLIKDQNTALADNVGAEGDIMTSALRWNPTRPFRDADGVLIQPSDNERNPMAFLEYYDDNTQTARIFGNISATVNIVKGLDYKINYGVDRTNSERRVAVSNQLKINPVTSVGGIGNIEIITGSSSVVEHTLNYARDVNPNFNFNILAGYSYQRFNRRTSNTRGTNFIESDQDLYLSNLDYAATFPPNQNSSTESPTDELQSIFGRVNVSLSNKFLITGTVRSDGSSRFGENNKYGVFPSAAAAYRLSEEDFIPDAFSDLKLRLGWGITGNQEFPSGSSQTQYRPLADGTGITQSTVGNPDLQWEETTQINAGLDFGFWDGRLTTSVDVYQKITDNLLFRLRSAQQAPDVFVWRNLEGVEVKNRGIDFTIEGAAIEKTDFTLDLGLNLTFLRNTIHNVSPIFPDGIITGEINGQGLSDQRAQLLYDDQNLNEFYLAVFTGYDEDGLSTFEDLNGDNDNTASGIVGPGKGDRTFVGNPNPTTILGFRANARFRNFDFSMYFNGAFGHKVFDNTALALFSRAALSGGANVDKRVLNSGQSIGDSPVPSTQFLESGDFVRLSNATLGYNFPRNNENSPIQSLRVYVSGQNLFLITDYKGFDPEVNTNKNIDSVPSFGIDYASYPRSTLWTFGVNVSF